MFVHHDIDVNQSDAQGGAALMCASRDGHLDIVRLRLARHDVEVNLASAQGFTALHVASQNGHLDIVRFLLARQDVEVAAWSAGCSTVHEQRLSARLLERSGLVDVATQAARAR